jgi:transcriptional regulator with XRE-family HTH domain
MTFADRLKYARARAKISQESLAHKCGITKASVSKFELGLTQSPAMETLFALADILQVDPRWLATGKNHNPSTDSPVLRIDANKALSQLPAELREPIINMIESAAHAAEQRYWAWVKEREDTKGDSSVGNS